MGNVHTFAEGLSLVNRPRYVIRRSSLVLYLLLIYLAGAHLRISLYSGSSILLPMYPMLLSAAILTVIYLNELLQSGAKLFVILAGAVLLQPVLTIAPHSGYAETLLSCIQLLVAIIAAMAVIHSTSKISAVRLRRLTIIIWGVVIVLAVLESTGLKPAFDAVRNTLFASSGRGVYDAALRDLTLYGQVRPTVFASEPSHLADTLGTLIVLTFCLDPKRGRLWSWLLMGGMLVGTYMMAPSFKLAFYLLALMVWQFWPTTRRGVIAILGIILILGLLLMNFFGPILIFFTSHLGTHADSGSFFGRIGVAPGVGMEALRLHPLVGYGVGNDLGAYNLVRQAWQSSGAFAIFPWFASPELGAQDLMSNGFWWQWIFLGGGGGLVFSIIVVRLLASIGVQYPLRSLVCTWILWYAGAAFFDPHSWFLVALFSIGAVRRNESDLSATS